MNKEKRAKLDARKSRREIYYSGVKHYNTLPERRKLSQALTNYPSLRAYKSELTSEVVELTARFNFYLSLAFPQKTVTIEAGSRRYENQIQDYLQSVTESLGQRLSNYTIKGLIESERYGPRHKPTKGTITKLNQLILWLEQCCKAAEIWKPFKFHYHVSEYDKQRGLLVAPKPKTKNETNKTASSTDKERRQAQVIRESKPRFSNYATLLEWHREGESDSG